jgi:hypothetical protein
MYIPSELNLYYVYAKSTRPSAASRSPPCSPTAAVSFDNPGCPPSHSSPDDTTTITKEDFETLLTVLDDSRPSGE